MKRGKWLIGSRMIEARGKKLIIALFVSMPLLAMLAFAALYVARSSAGSSGAAEKPPITIATFEGGTAGAVLTRGGETMPLGEGDAVRSGDTIRVGGQKAARFAAAFPAARFALGPGTIAHFDAFDSDASKGNLRLTLERGAVKADMSPTETPNTLEAVAPTLVSALHAGAGSALAFTYDDTVRTATLYVLKGKAFVWGPHAARADTSGLSLEAGYLVAVGEDGDARGVRKILDTPVPLADVEL